MRKITLAIICLLAMACSKKDNNDPELTQWNVTKVEGASTGSVNQAVTLTVSWPYTSGCDALEKFEETRTGNTVSIIAKGYTAEGICTQDAGIKTKTYQFTSPTSGTFELKFLNRDGSVITHSITIN